MGIGTIAIIGFIFFCGLIQYGKDLIKQEKAEKVQKEQDELERKRVENKAMELKNAQLALVNEHNNNLKVSESSSNVESSSDFLTINQVLVGLIFLLLLTVGTVFYFKMLYLD